MSVTRPLPSGSRPGHRRRAVTGLIAAVTGALALAGCATGERPSFSDDTQPSVVDPAIASVIDLLEVDPSTPVTAEYEILTKFGGVTTPAVLVDDGTRRSVTIGDVRFLIAPGDTRTCTVSTGECTTGVDDARVSDVLVTHAFADASPAARLRYDAQTAIAPGAASDDTIAGLPVTCVDITVTGGVKRYCATDIGLLALQDTADVRIELLSLSADADPAAFSPS